MKHVPALLSFNRSWKKLRPRHCTLGASSPRGHSTKGLSILSRFSPSAGLKSKNVTIEGKKEKGREEISRQIELWQIRIVLPLQLYLWLIHQTNHCINIDSIRHTLQNRQNKMSLPQLLVGKVAAITGGLTGIGRVCNSPYSPYSRLYRAHANSLC